MESILSRRTFLKILFGGSIYVVLPKGKSNAGLYGAANILRISKPTQPHDPDRYEVLLSAKNSHELRGIETVSRAPKNEIHSLDQILVNGNLDMTRTAYLNTNTSPDYDYIVAAVKGWDAGNVPVELSNLQPSDIFQDLMLLDFGPKAFYQQSPTFDISVVALGVDLTRKEMDVKIEDGVIVHVENQAADIPTAYNLLQNYPNPFIDATTIKYFLPEPTHVFLQVYNILGQAVGGPLVDKMQGAGEQVVRFDAGSLPVGTYFYKIKMGKYIQVKKMQVVQ